jgi:RimJ/RimL family protein N-acetyltransferase
MLGEAARGRGVMTQAVRLLAQWAIEELGVAQIEIFAHPENLASIAVAERAGFVRECLLRGYRVKKGRREDRVVLSLTASGLWS